MLEARTAVAVIFGLAMTGCGGAAPSAGPEVPEGAPTAEQAVEIFLKSAQEAKGARERGELGAADQAYARMAAVFGTDDGSIRRAYPAGEVRSRMIVLSACLRPISFRISSQGVMRSQTEGRTVVTVDLERDDGTHTLPFRLVRGRAGRWFIEQIEFGSFAC